jgi:hypothetical protein
MIEEMMQELSAAMRYNPDLSVRQVIALALEFQVPTRRKNEYDGKGYKYKATNSDILSDLKVYNNARQKDSVRYHSLVG